MAATFAPASARSPADAAAPSLTDGCSAAEAPNRRAACGLRVPGAGAALLAVCSAGGLKIDEET